MLESLYRAEVLSMLRWCVKRGLTVDDAEDLVQQVFAEVIAASPTELLRAFVWQRLHWRYVCWLRKRRELVPWQADVRETRVMPRYADPDLAKAWCELTKQQQEALTEQYWEDLTDAESAARHGISRNTARGRRWRAIQTLQRAMEVG